MLYIDTATSPSHRQSGWNMLRRHSDIVPIRQGLSLFKRVAHVSPPEDTGTLRAQASAPLYFPPHNRFSLVGVAARDMC